MKNGKRELFVNVGLPVLLCLLPMSMPQARADEGADWKAMQSMEKQLGDKATAEARIVGYGQFLNASKPGVIVGCTALGHISDAQREQKKYEEAIATCRQQRG